MKYRAIKPFPAKFPRAEVVISSGSLFEPSAHLRQCITTYGEQGLRDDDYYSGTVFNLDGARCTIEILGKNLKPLFQNGTLEILPE